MKSSSRLPSLVAVAVALGAAGSIALLRPGLAERFDRVKERTDVYALPKPEQAVVASLGYRAALSDLLFAHVLVWHGLHFSAKRRLEFAADYLDTVVALDPTFRDPYYFGDTLIAVQPTKPRREDYVRARNLLERGMDARPYDTELWLSAGQFMAYVAAPWLDDPKEQAEWRLAGARRLAHACEIVSSNENIPFQCISAASLFSKAGEVEAAVDFCSKMLVVSDDEEIQQLARACLMKAMDARESEHKQRRSDEIRAAWRADLAFASPGKELILGPGFDVARCAGGNASVACATTWAAWRARTDDGSR